MSSPPPHRSRPATQPATVLHGFPAGERRSAPSARSQRRGGGAGLAAGLLVLTGVVVLLLALPVNQVRSSSDPDRLATHASAILAHPEAQAALADEISTRITSRVTGESGLARKAVRATVAPRIDRLVASDRFAAAWEQGVRTAATRLLDPTVDYVAVDVNDIVAMTAEVTRPFPPSISKPLERTGSLTVLNVDRTPAQQRGLETLDWLNGLAVPGMLFGTALLLLALAVSRNRRRTAIVIGTALVVLSLLLLGLSALIRAAVVDATDPGRAQTVAGIVADELLGDFRTRNLVGIGLGVALISLALLTGRRSRPAR